jgi:hypothetical protein
MKRMTQWLVAGLVAIPMASWAMSASEVQLSWDLPGGVYRCAYGEPLIGVERQQTPSEQVKIHYQRRIYELAREPSSSGLPRYTNPQAGLLWVDLPWKGVLLNLANERPIANDCTHAPEMTLAQLSSSGSAPKAQTKGGGKVLARASAQQQATHGAKSQRVAKAGDSSVKR